MWRRVEEEKYAVLSDWRQQQQQRVRKVRRREDHWSVVEEGRFAGWEGVGWGDGCTREKGLPALGWRGAGRRRQWSEPTQ